MVGWALGHGDLLISNTIIGYSSYHIFIGTHPTFCESNLWQTIVFVLIYIPKQRNPVCCVDVSETQVRFLATLFGEMSRGNVLGLSLPSLGPSESWSKKYKWFLSIVFRLQNPQFVPCAGLLSHPKLVSVLRIWSKPTENDTVGVICIFLTNFQKVLVTVEKLPERFHSSSSRIV